MVPVAHVAKRTWNAFGELEGVQRGKVCPFLFLVDRAHRSPQTGRTFMQQPRNDSREDPLFLTRRVRGFTVVVSRAYSHLMESPKFESLLADACRYSMEKRKNGAPSVLTDELPGGVPVHVKYWQPRREHHRLKTLWKPSRPESAGLQHVDLTRKGLPVTELIMYAYRKLPTPRWGLYLAGITVTRLEDCEDLRVRLGNYRTPWKENRTATLRQLAGLLTELHEQGYIHGDFMLKNVLYCPERSCPFLLTDLESGFRMRAKTEFGRQGRTRDLFRMVVSLARNGFSRDELIAFLRAYGPGEGVLWDAGKPESGLDRFLTLPDRRAVELARWAKNQSA